MTPVIRVATPADVPLLEELIARSVRTLQTHDYTAQQIEIALRTVYGVDEALVADCTYFVVEVAGTLAACGGWSTRKKLYGSKAMRAGDDERLDPTRDAAKIRAFFVDPAFARRGLGTALLHACEDAARAAGFIRFEMGATLTGVPLYERWGYVAVGRQDLTLADGEVLAVVHTVKRD